MADRYDIDRDRERGRGDWDRDRERSNRWNREFGSERSGDRRHEEYDRDRDRSWQSNENRYGEARYEDYGRNRRPDEQTRDDYSTRGDWGNTGRWGNYGNRADYDRENTWRENRREEPHLPRSPESDWGGARSGRTNLFGTGGGGFGTGFSSYGAGVGPYTGGMGSYGERERGRFAGRGPKGWQRSDERIREDLNERLTDHPHIDASEIDVHVQNGEVTLGGTVDDRNAKRLAEDIAESVSGVREVHNNIRVRQYRDQGQISTQGVTESRGTTGTGSRSK